MFCQKTKEYLSQKGVQFTERDVTKDPEAFDQLKKWKAMTTPVTLIGDRVVVGFDEEKIDQALKA